MNVIGVEFVEAPIKQFFNECNFDFTVQQSEVLPGCNVYSYGDRLSIYHCDIFKITPDLFGGACDYLWDRGALEAIECENRHCYSGVVQSVLSTNARGLIEAISYERGLQPETPTRTPFSTMREDIDEFYGGRFSVQVVSKKKASQLPDWYATEIPGIAGADYMVYYFQGKVE